MSKKMKTILASIGTLAIFLTGCGSSPTSAATNKPQTTTKSSSSHHGNVVIALGPLIGINWFLPLRPIAYNSGYDATAASLMYKGLFHIGQNGKINYKRSIAQKITWNPSGTTYTITINPKWHWSNGTAVTAKDVAFTWQMIQAASSKKAVHPWPMAGVGAGGVPNLIQTFKVLSTQKFQIILKHPVNQLWFVYNGLPDFFPMPKMAWDKYPKNPTQELAYLGKNGNNVSFLKVVDGPFRLISATNNAHWVFKPNTKYNGHKASLHRLIFQYETSDAAEFNALKTGVVQVGYLPASMYGSRKQLSADRLIPRPSDSIARTALNFKSSKVGNLFGNRYVREALAMGIDQPQIIKGIYNNMAVPDYGPVPTHPHTFLAPALKKPIYPFNPSAGKKLLLAHGFHLVHGVMENKKGQALSFSVMYVAGSTATAATIQLVQQDWLKEGIKVHLLPTPFSTMLHDHRHPNRWDIMTGMTWGFGGTYPTGGGLYSSHGAFNFFGYHNTTLDKLIIATHTPHKTTKGAQKALDAYQMFVAKHLPSLFMPVPMSLEEVAKTVHGVVSTENNVTGSLAPQYWHVA